MLHQKPPGHEDFSRLELVVPLSHMYPSGQTAVSVSEDRPRLKQIIEASQGMHWSIDVKPGVVE
jgi:hypothetical protein